MSSVTSTDQASISEARILVQGHTRQDGPDDEAQKKLDRTIRTIKAHFSSRHQESSLELKLDHELVHSRRIAQLLDKTGVRYYYFDEDTLFIFAMPSSIHDSLEALAVSGLHRLKTEILTPEEARNLCPNVGPVHLNGKIKSNSTKCQALNKSPDQAFVFLDPQTYRRYPTVIFEAGFSETYEDLIIDMKRWLLFSCGRVQLVILVDINEDKKPLLKQQRSCSFKHRAAKILKDFGNELGKSKHGDILSCICQGDKVSDTSSALSPELDYEIDDIIQAEDWVGPITVDLEFWILKGSQPHKRDHGRVFPEPARLSPPIYAGDVIPLSYQGTIPNFDPLRKLYLDLEEFQHCLLGGIRDDAVRRAWGFACPSSQDNADEDYQE
ncbi:hypothetical protein BDV26DRAFT_281932 [Aspergillus bertholletiae]|uniref:Uncharacterized protein n=1 Tax=Aspergillus bertholletiae TaxID=1226010 RepID=A0A5N7B5B5_9EURO|nr:hypothetical protein BDV26DRAFT_281932 [Aspergillus bertholletiae]